MKDLSYKNQVQKLIKQIGTLQSIDTDKHKYFSEKASKMLDSASQGDYSQFIDLQSELIDCLEDKVRDNSVKNYPTTIQKQSLIDRIGDLFKGKNKESEISKISRQIYIDTEKEEGQYIPDRRKKVYDFFKEVLPNIDGGRRNWGNLQTIKYLNANGKRNEFNIGKDKYGSGIIKVGNVEFRTFFDSDGDYMFEEIRRNAIYEYLCLIAYDKFISSKTEDKTFINEFGREVEKAAMGYIPDNIESLYRVGENLDKALRKNPIYRQTKKSFDRAYKEYQETYMQFMTDEASREEDFKKGHSFDESIKVQERNASLNKESVNRNDRVEEDREQGM